MGKKVPKAKLTKLPPGINEEKIKGYRRYKCWSCNGTKTQQLSN